MSTELFYLLGRPNRIKQALVLQLKDRLKDEASIVVPEIYTTDEEIAKGENYIWIDKRDFHLRYAIGMYCLDWQANNQYYGVVADVVQRLNMGVDVVLNGSMHNLEQAMKQFPTLNTIIIQKHGCRGRRKFTDNSNQYLVAEDGNVKLEWNESNSDMGHPYVLALATEDDIPKAIDMLISLITYEKHCLDKVI